MPTGYTAELDKGISTKKWVMEHLVRAFGVCITLRDESMNMSEERIRGRLLEDQTRDIKYHKSGLDGAEKELSKISRMTQTQWQAAAEKERRGRVAENMRSANDASRIKALHDRAAKELIEITEKVTSQTTKDIARFGMEQLEATKSETTPYVQDTGFTWKQYRAEREKSVVWDVKHHTKGLKKAEKRWKERLQAFDDILADFKRIFK